MYDHSQETFTEIRGDVIIKSENALQHGLYDGGLDSTDPFEIREKIIGPRQASSHVGNDDLALNRVPRWPKGVEESPIIVAHVVGEHDKHGRDKVVQALAIDGDSKVDDALVVDKAHALA